MLNDDHTIASIEVVGGCNGNPVSYTHLAEEYGVAFRKGSDAAAAVDAALDALKADGTMQALAEQYELTLAD